MFTRLFLLLGLVNTMLVANPIPVKAIPKLPISPVAPPQPTQAQIDAAADEARTQGRVILLTPGSVNLPEILQQMASLPVTFRSTIGNWNYDIIVLSMRFTPTGSVASVGCRFFLPGTGNSPSLYFGANDIVVSGKSGFKGDLPILQSLLSDAKRNELDDPAGTLAGETEFFEFPLPAFQGKAWMGLDKNAKLSFSCGEFKKFSLSGFVKIYDLVEREDPAGQVLTDGKPLLFSWDSQDVFDWQDIYFPVTASRGFHAANVPDIGFQSTNKTKVLLDLSTYQSPANLPDCGGGNPGNSWQGIYFDAFSLRLPALFKLHMPRTLLGQGANLFLAPNGIIGTVTAQNVFALDEGYTDETNKFDLSLDQVTANFSCGAEASVGMTGRFRLGRCGPAADKAKELYYTIAYTSQDKRYQVLLKESETDRFKNNGLTLSTGSTLSLAVQNDQVVFQTALPAKPRLSTPAYANSICLNYPTTLTVNNCESVNSRWSTGETNKPTITVNPAKTTTYSINCFDAYCINETSDDLTITVYESLPQPKLTATAGSFCAYERSSVQADNCVGKLEWLVPGASGFDGLGSTTQTAYFPEQPTTNVYTYQVRCNLNTCLSPERTLSLTVYPEPKAPSLWSSAFSNTIDRNNSVTISGACEDGNTLLWDNLPQATITLASSATYYAYCKNKETGCQTQNHASIGINVLYFPPAGPSPITFGAVGTNYITINWQDNSNNEDGFWVDRATSPDFAQSVRIGEVGSNVTSLVDPNLSEGITYYYRVIAHNRYDDGYSETVSRTTGLTPNAPVLTAASTSIVRGASSLVQGFCRVGALVWVSPTGFSGGTFPQSDNITYAAKCSASGLESSTSYLTVMVYDKPVVNPCSTPPAKPVLYLNGQAGDVTFNKGESIQVTAFCAQGSVVWTQGTDGNGGNLAPTGNTYYAAQCKQDDCVSEESGRVAWMRAASSEPTPPSIGSSGGCTTPPKPIVYINGSSGEITFNKGESIQVTAFCAQGGIIWTQGTDGQGTNLAPTGNTYYAAKCQQGDCLSEEGGNIAWIKKTTAGSFDNPANPPSLSGCITPDKPVIYLNNRTDNLTITKGETVQIMAYCAQGGVVWTQGTDGNGANLAPTGNTYYAAKCQQGNCISEEGGNIVWVNESSTGSPASSGGCSTPAKPVVYLNNQTDNLTISKGETVQLTAHCDQGNVIWTQGTDGNGSNLAPTGNTYYAAKCRQGDCISEEGGNVVWVRETSTSLPSNSSNPPAGCTTPPKPIVYLNNHSDNITIIRGETVQVTASCAQGSVVWTQGTDGNGSNLAPTGNTYYAAKCQQGTCMSEEGGNIVWVNENSTSPSVPSGGCTPPSKPVIYLNGLAQALTITKSVSVQVNAYCAQGSVVWTQGTDGNGANLAPTGNTYYAAKCQQGDCLSEEGGQIVWVNESTAGTTSPPSGCNTPAKPVVYLNNQNQAIIITKGESIQLRADCPSGSSVVWTQGTDGNGSNLSPSGNTYYAAKCKSDNGGCLSEEVGQVARVNEWVDPTVIPPSCMPPSPPSLSPSSWSIRQGDRVILYARNCPAGSSVDWQDDNDNTQVERSLYPDQTTTYYARCWQASSCYSDWVGVTITVTGTPPCANPPTPIVKVSETFVQEGTLVTLRAEPCAYVVVWYKNDQKTNYTGSPLTITTGTGEYSAECVDRTCTSGNTSNHVLITFTAKPVAPVSITPIPLTPVVPVCRVPTLSISRFSNYMTAYTNGCSSEVSWYKEGAPYFSRTLIATGSSVDVSQYGLGRYEARCSNGCGENYAVDYARE